MSSFPYHPDYGHLDELRAMVVEHVMRTRCSYREAAEMFRVGKTSVGEWMRDVRMEEK